MHMWETLAQHRNLLIPISGRRPYKLRSTIKNQSTCCENDYLLLWGSGG